ncbi:trypsin-like serine protease with C-terminal PDZdomain [Mizugakiibacter sediminis]|uniref:Trypsin-like serine protease with C-terminal PDZdomain n=1 Tax=Mizugakiibacter sediminis TaxID=1475481 RepID=A0A0K8QJI6_9GAMM|nr:trypsin-like peptidase domain-containing protein [Mizugakiibacter sediminis]GAP64994.1 trypsin-like serine protease with C-terminal PDZdomain [Mizugakiibacter sediminis]
MTRLARALSFVIRFAIVGLAAAFVIAFAWPQAGAALRTRFGLAGAAAAAPPAAAAKRGDGPVSYADAVARAAPAVVNIYANKLVTERQLRVFPDPLLRRLFGGVALGPAYQRREQSLGSGVIASADGYVLTNNHVIAGADDIQVLLYDGRVARARVIGTDADTDLAVLKIDARRLPAVAVAASKPPRVGDVVLAIGNPFGIGQTVTMGIVSAIGRQLNLSTYEDFIQTDAAINSGNSGGALINARGELVGINTAMLGRASGAEGIGFAIPVRTANAVLEQILDHGSVTRGWIGADFGRVPIAADSSLPAAPRGAEVLDVYIGGPAAKAGLRPGDVLLRLDEHDILDPSDLRNREAALKPGTAVTLSGLRDGTPFRAALVLAQRPRHSSLGEG